MRTTNYPIGSGLLVWALLALVCVVLGHAIDDYQQQPQEAQATAKPIQTTTQPPLGLCTNCKVLRVKDGDTVQVEVKRVLEVRLLDVWAPEKGTPEGERSTKGLVGMIEGKEVRLFIPGSQRDKVSDLLTFGRVLGILYTDEGQVNRRLVEQGFATEEKVK